MCGILFAVWRVLKIRSPAFIYINVGLLSRLCKGCARNAARFTRCIVAVVHTRVGRAIIVQRRRGAVASMRCAATVRSVLADWRPPSPPLPTHCHKPLLL